MIRESLANPASISRALAYPNGFSSCAAFITNDNRIARFQKVDEQTMASFFETLSNAGVMVARFTDASGYVKALRALR